MKAAIHLKTSHNILLQSNKTKTHLLTFNEAPFNKTVMAQINNGNFLKTSQAAMKVD
jgi:hypothetical protein